MNGIFTIDTLRNTVACHKAMQSLPSPENTSYTRYLNLLGVTYIGIVDSSSKAMHGSSYGTKCYFVYLLPANSAGSYIDGIVTRPINVCPNSAHCREACLAGSGHARVEHLAGKDNIYRARLLKTKLLYERPDIFYAMVEREIVTENELAMKKCFDFCVRLNATSDIDHSRYTFPTGGNIFERHPDIQFYDYTKVPGRLGLASRYENVFLTLSYNGYNEAICTESMAQGFGVAVVFKGDLPEEWMGYSVINGDLFDMRFFDKTYYGIPKKMGYVVGLKYKPVFSDYKEGKFIGPKESKFIVESKIA